MKAVPRRNPRMKSMKNLPLPLVFGGFVLHLFLCGHFVFAQSAGANLPASLAQLIPFHDAMPTPRPGEWLAEHKEPGQTLAEYRKTNHVKAVPERKTIYVQILGDMTERQKKIIGTAKEYLEIYFGLPVKMLPSVSVSRFPKTAQRTHPSWGNHQLLTSYILEKVLQPRLPKDACVLIAFTGHDLYPGDGWNFVFGYASYQDRVGVWSIYRNGDPAESDEDYTLCLKRTLRLATHETLHMFSMLHCTQYRCNLNGVNHLQEADATPLWLCPECLGKLKLATGADLKKRFDALIAFHDKHSFADEAAFYRKVKAALR